MESIRQYVRFARQNASQFFRIDGLVNWIGGGWCEGFLWKGVKFRLDVTLRPFYLLFMCHFGFVAGEENRNTWDTRMDYSCMMWRVALSCLVTMIMIMLMVARTITICGMFSRRDRKDGEKKGNNNNNKSEGAFGFIAKKRSSHCDKTRSLRRIIVY